MRREIASTEIKAKFAAVLRNVERGEEYVITRNGKAVGLLSPARRDDTEAAAAFQRLKALRDELRGKGKAMTRSEIVGMFREMRKGPHA